jgi:hypothetical protein
LHSEVFQLNLYDYGQRFEVEAEEELLLKQEPKEMVVKYQKRKASPMGLAMEREFSLAETAFR